jgi:[lysine-biosynthesis-protein LysW]--L-2-aminoadipate ligase
MSVKLGLAYTMMTPENMALKAALAGTGAEVVLVSDEHEQFDVHQPAEKHGEVDALLCRSSSLTRSLCLSYILESQGVNTINTHSAQQICGDKAMCSALLAKAGIPTPKVALAFSAQSALAAADKMGYPCVIKPPVGSWGRMVHKIHDRACAEAVVSLKSQLGHYTDKIYYIQEYIDKPDSDIRVLLVGDEIALSVCRKASKPGEFITNLHAGATAEHFELPSDMAQTAQKVGDLLGLGIYGIDFVQGKGGEFYVLEVNHAPEFSKSAGASKGKVAEKIAQFAYARAKN